MTLIILNTARSVENSIERAVGRVFLEYVQSLRNISGFSYKALGDKTSSSQKNRNPFAHLWPAVLLSREVFPDFDVQERGDDMIKNTTCDTERSMTSAHDWWVMHPL